MFFRQTMLPGILVVVFFVLLFAWSTPLDIPLLVVFFAVVLLWFFPVVAYGMVFFLIPFQIFFLWNAGITWQSTVWFFLQAFMYYTTLVLEKGDLSVPFSVSAILHVFLTLPASAAAVFFAVISGQDFVNRDGTNPCPVMLFILPFFLFSLSWALFFVLFRFRNTLSEKLAFPLLSIPFVISSVACIRMFELLPGPPQ